MEFFASIEYLGGSTSPPPSNQPFSGPRPRRPRPHPGDGPRPAERGNGDAAAALRPATWRLFAAALGLSDAAAAHSFRPRGGVHRRVVCRVLALGMCGRGLVVVAVFGVIITLVVWNW